MSEVDQILEEIGLSKNEALVYKSMIHLGDQSASRISEVANLNRISTYSLLKSLKEKGFCSIYNKNKIQYFKPISPENILALLEDKKNKIKSIIPSLKLKIEGEKPEINLYEGKKGITGMLDIILKDAERDKQVYAYGNFSIAEKLIEYQSLYWRKTRIEKKIRIKAVVESFPKDFEAPKFWKELTEIKVNNSLSKIKTYVHISRNYVGYLTFSGEINGILIKSKEIVEKEKFIFEML